MVLQYALGVQSIEVAATIMAAAPRAVPELILRAIVNQM